MKNSFNNISNKTFSVNEITKRVKFILEDTFPSVWVEGEISNFKRTASGHVYFSLKDQFSQISAVMFRFAAVTYMQPDIIDGVKVKVFGKISVYEKSGNYQIICSKLEKIGIGDLQLRFLELKEKLYKQGWFAAEKKKKIPQFPEKVAIVTSKTGAAVRDMLNIIYSRYENAKVVIFPVKVQGDGAKEEIAEAINQINNISDISLIITGRGGGSIEDLWAFNEYVVAEAIFESKIPVISAVGHEIDFTIADFVADQRAETPSAAAVMAYPLKEDIIDSLINMKHILNIKVIDKVNFLRRLVESYQNHYSFKDPLNKVAQFAQRVDSLNESLIRVMDNQILFKKQLLAKYLQVLKTLSPYNILERGYSVTTDSSGMVIKNAHSLKTESIIFTRFFQGTVKSKTIKN